MPLQKPPNGLTELVFYLGPAGHHRQIRRLWTVPDLAEATAAPAVSSATVSPSSPLRLIAVAVAPLMTEMHRRLSSPSTMLR